MLDKIKWKPLMEILYPYPLYQVPDAPGKLVDFEELRKQHEAERKLKRCQLKTTQYTSL
jgi:hypothetical protein